MHGIAERQSKKVVALKNYYKHFMKSTTSFYVQYFAWIFSFALQLKNTRYSRKKKILQMYLLH